ncbi:galactitol-1-phosphate 5-dehydrogenase [Geobacillus kaustophilus]|uniref:galactitol-1-phosphate 5-dehydrogenase n=1 Tax=Geobacillus kaustophilus TaxID=1462 RepID=UPI002E1B6AAD|nr:galactitol-1-phosphate 5-dehydrogenase [Geobacillus kaustophilus]
MKALNLYGIQDLRFEDSPKPVIQHEHDVIIKVKAAGICGSDLSRYQKLGPYVPGMTFGHEFSGEVVEIGAGVERFKPGDRVGACPAFVCGTCEPCKSGHPSQCIKLHVIGAKHPGAFAEYVKLPEDHLLHLPDEVDFETAALLEPSCVVAHGFYRANIQPGADIAIMGVGSIGLLAVQWAKIFGAKRVFAIDVDEQKLEIAKQLGADVLIHSSLQSPYDQLMEHTDGRGVDVAVESAGSPFTSAHVLSLPRKGGKVVFMGIPYADVKIERFYFEKIVRNELTIYGSWNAISAPFPGREWASTLYYMSTGQITAKPLISHRLELSQGPETFQKIANKEMPCVKVLFLP